LSPAIRLWVGFGFGNIALLVVLAFSVIAFFLPPPQDPAILSNFLNVLQVILALASAGVGAIIPGWLAVKLNSGLPRGGRVAIDAGGALALFAIVFFFQPASLTLNALEDRISFNELLETCRSNTFPNPNAGPRPTQFASCRALVKDYPKRWAGYLAIARYHYRQREYDESLAYYQLSTVKLTNARGFTDALTRVPQTANLTDYIDSLRGVRASAIGIIRKCSNSECLGVVVVGRRALERTFEIYSTQPTLHTVQLERNLLFDSAAFEQETLSAIEAINGDNRKDKIEYIEIEWEKYLKKTNIAPIFAHYYMACLYANEMFLNSNNSNYGEESELYRKTTEKIINIFNLAKAHPLDYSKDILICYLKKTGECGLADDPPICPNLRMLLSTDMALSDIVSEGLASI